MELSKEVHSLLERIKKLSQQAQKNENCSNFEPCNTLNKSLINSNHSMVQNDEISFSYDDLIPVENMDFSDDERWLYVSENSMINPYTGDLMKWLHQDFNTTIEDDISELESLKFDAKKYIDTRTFTRPKKRINRPSLEQLTEGYYTQSSSSRSSDSFPENTAKTSNHSLTEDLSSESSHSEYLSAMNSVRAAPVQFNLSEPVSHTSFDRILANCNESFDSFQNMSPPSLMNSLCSSTFTTLMDSGYINHETVPNDSIETYMHNSLILNENNDPNVTYTNDYRIKTDKNDSFKDKSLNETYEIKIQNKMSDTINTTYPKLNEKDLNSTFKKNTSNNKNNDSTPYNISGTQTITKKSKASNLLNSFKASCPDINRTFQKSYDCNLDLTFQKLSDSQPNLTEDLKRTLINQSMELMNPSETFHSARSGSADSLDDRSSSISNSSKESGTKILNMGDLDNLAKVQDFRLHQAMSTPKPAKTRLLLMEGEALSPIQNRMADEDYLSDSDLSDICVTARSGFSKQSSPARTNLIMDTLTKPDVPTSRPLSNKPEVSHPTLRTVPTMIVKPMEVNRTMVQPSKSHISQVPAAARPKMRASGLPRPTSTTTGIPRPTSRIPGPKSLRPPMVRPSQRQLPKSDWMDGCY